MLNVCILVVMTVTLFSRTIRATLFTVQHKLFPLQFCSVDRFLPKNCVFYSTSKSKPFIGKGFLVPCKVKGPLFDLLQEEELTRSEAVKLVWKYIKDQGLQNPENRRIIMSDHKLYPLFGKEEVTFGEVGKAIHKHLETIRKPVE